MKIRRKQRETRTHALKWLLLLATVALCFVAYEGALGVYHVVERWATTDMPDLENTDAFNYAQDSHIYAGSDGGVMLAKFQLENRDPLTSQDQISPYVLKGTVDTEDVRYYEHNGVDPTGIMRAVVNNITGGSLEGASTITQQLVRNTVLSQEANDISLERKVREAQLALDMEKLYSKDQILVMYLNTINYGDGCYGIEAAAQHYFSTSALNLTLPQAATLVGIPQSPTYNNPRLYPEASFTRRNLVLDRMLTAGDITKEEYDAAKATPLELVLAPEPPAEGIYAYPYFTSYVSKLLQTEGNPYGVSSSQLFEGGLSIYTTLDPAMQDKAEAACANQRDRMPSELDASLVAIDPNTGYIRAMVGGKDYYGEAGRVNLATGTLGGGSGRQPGSTFKAFALAAAIQTGISPSTLLDCTSPMVIPGTEYSAENPLTNFDGMNYGIMSLQTATTVSSNTGFVRLTQQISPNAVAAMAQEVGITTPISPVLSVALGSQEVSPLDMASAYGTFAAGGVRHAPIAITKIVDHNGKVIYEAPTEGKQVLSEEVAGAVTKVLRTVFTSSGGYNGTASGFAPTNGQPVAGKTGTSQNFADHWLVGYSPQLVCSTWVGNPAGNIETDRGLSCNQLWQEFMSSALDGQEIIDFPTTKDPEYKNPFNQEQQKKYGSASNENKTDKPENANGNLAAAPNTTGKTFAEAQSLLNGFNAYYSEEYSDTVPANVVISQSISGDRILLVVSKGPKPASSP